MKIDLFGKRFFETFYHYILEFDLAAFECKESKLKMVEISKDNIDEAVDAVGHTTRKWIIEGNSYVRGFFFKNEDDKKIGSCWIMFKGGNEKLYKIRKHDCMLFRLEVSEGYRGKGYSKEIMKMMFKTAKDSSCNMLCIACSTKNVVALKLYDRIGMKKTGKRFFIRFLNRNIPYYVL